MTKEDSLKAFEDLFRSLRGLDQFETPLYWSSLARLAQIDTLKLVTPMDVAKVDNYAAQFIKGSGPSVMFPIVFASYLFGYGFRAVNSKSFCVFTKTPLYIYSCSKITGANMSGTAIRYGITFVVSEGLMDSEAIGMFYGHSFASLTNHVTDVQSQFISMFTNKVILVPDNDGPGEVGTKKSEENLHRYGVKTERLTVPKEYKDPGKIFYEAVVSKSEDAIRGMEIMSKEFSLKL